MPQLIPQTPPSSSTPRRRIPIRRPRLGRVGLLLAGGAAFLLTVVGVALGLSVLFSEAERPGGGAELSTPSPTPASVAPAEVRPKVAQRTPVPASRPTPTRAAATPTPVNLFAGTVEVVAPTPGGVGGALPTPGPGTKAVAPPFSSGSAMPATSAGWGWLGGSLVSLMGLGALWGVRRRRR